MPLHDWTDQRGWDSVHPLWLTYLLEYVQERLPEGYKAFLGGVPSLTLQSCPRKAVGMAPNACLLARPECLGSLPLTDYFSPGLPNVISYCVVLSSLVFAFVLSFSVRVSGSSLRAASKSAGLRIDFGFGCGLPATTR